MSRCIRRPASILGSSGGGSAGDADVKLYYYGARYYDPYLGRFITLDPAGQGLNWYVYANNNPLKYVDATGMFFSFNEY